MPTILKGLYWGATELAEKYQCDPSHIRRILAEEKIQGIKIGRTWLIPDIEAQKLLAKPKEAHWANQASQEKTIT